MIAEELLYEAPTKLENKGNYTMPDNTSNPDLCNAVRFGNSKEVELLIKNGADVNKVATDLSYRGMSPLFVAVSSGRLDMVKLLIDNGADVNAAISVAVNDSYYSGMTEFWMNVKTDKWDMFQY